MPLDTFCGEAICVDIREYERGHDVTADEVAQAVEASGQELREGDILLFCSDHYNRTAGTPAFLDGFCGISAEAVHWMADRGVKIFGVETISPDLVYLTDEYPTHKACAERGLTHYENLNNLAEVARAALPVRRPAPAARGRLRLAGAGRRNSGGLRRTGAAEPDMCGLGPQTPDDARVRPRKSSAREAGRTSRGLLDRDGRLLRRRG